MHWELNLVLGLALGTRYLHSVYTVFWHRFSALPDIWSSNPESSEGELIMQAQASRFLPGFSQNAVWFQVGGVSPGGEAGVESPGGGGKLLICLSVSLVSIEGYDGCKCPPSP